MSTAGTAHSVRPQPGTRAAARISLSPHPYHCVHESFTAYTCAWGTIAVQGDKKDEIDSLGLQVLDGDTVLAEMELGRGAQNKLLHKPFGAGKRLEITSNQLLFRLPSGQMSGIDQAQDETLTLRAKAISKDGQEAERVAQIGGTVKKLVLYTGTNRFGTRDPEQGGDGWALPSVKAVIDYYSKAYPELSWNDFSNMNGGHFWPHDSHDKGNDVDGLFPGYYHQVGNQLQVTAYAAQTLIQYLNDANDGSRISTVFVTFKQNPKDPFWSNIINVRLHDGRIACNVIRKWPKHDDHFHVRIDGPALGAVAGCPQNPP